MSLWTQQRVEKGGTKWESKPANRKPLDCTGNLTRYFLDKLEGRDGMGSGRETQEGRDICTLTANS